MRRIHWVTGLACGALAASPWFTWMWLRFGDRFVQQYLIAGNLWYFTKPPVFSTKTTSDTYYLRVFTGAFFPWSLIVIARGVDVLRARWEGVRPSVEELMLWLWLLVVMGFFTAARFRLDHYIFPAAPACCLLAAVGWRRAVAGTHAAVTRMALVAIAATFLVGGAIAGVAIMRINLGLERSALMLPIVLCAGGATLLVQIARARWSTPDSPAAPLLTLVAVYVIGRTHRVPGAATVASGFDAGPGRQGADRRGHADRRLSARMGIEHSLLRRQTSHRAPRSRRGARVLPLLAVRIRVHAAKGRGVGQRLGARS